LTLYLGASAQNLLNRLQKWLLVDSMVARGGVAMSNLLWLSEAQMRRIEPYFPLSHGVPRVDDCRVISGIIFVMLLGVYRFLRQRRKAQESKSIP
jgi:hypothetical protein